MDYLAVCTLLVVCYAKQKTRSRKKNNNCEIGADACPVIGYTQD